MKISIITVTYNAEENISDCLNSIELQTYKNVESIVVDGNSTDGTPELVKKHGVAKFVSEPDEGIYDAMNKGLDMATGDIVGFLNADDIFYDNQVLEHIAEAFTIEDISACYGNLVFVEKSGGIVRKWISKDFEKGAFAKSWTPAHPTFYCRKDLYEKYGRYRTDFKIAADVELMYRFLEINSIKSRFLNRFLVRMKTGGVSTRGLVSTFIITKEMLTAFKELSGSYNVVKYLFYKACKIKEYFI
ncbi:MAG: glycosyl transferase [Flavobacteriaceae bacterium]|nr:glycosyl transferase [Flavobacteriaceae bacterium]